MVLFVHTCKSYIDTRQAFQINTVVLGMPVIEELDGRFVFFVVLFAVALNNNNLGFKTRTGELANNARTVIRCVHVLSLRTNLVMDACHGVRAPILTFYLCNTQKVGQFKATRTPQRWCTHG